MASRHRARPFCNGGPTHSYRLKQLQLALDALAIAEKVAIMTNERGFLKLQLMVDLDVGDVQWIEFHVRAALRIESMLCLHFWWWFFSSCLATRRSSSMWRGLSPLVPRHRRHPWMATASTAMRLGTCPRLPKPCTRKARLAGCECCDSACVSVQRSQDTLPVTWQGL